MPTDLATSTLFSYVVRYDTGLAPNPFGGVCTLVLCKPRIRRAAEVGDWIVATGSAESSLGDMRGRLIYAMQVTKKMPMRMYDAYTAEHLVDKIPDRRSDAPNRIVGDSIYDFSADPPRLRQSLHSEENRTDDLGGEFALLSENFYYFGDEAHLLPESLQPIVKRGPGHRSSANIPFQDQFTDWISGLGLEANAMHGWPIDGPLRGRNPVIEPGPSAC